MSDTPRTDRVWMASLHQPAIERASELHQFACQLERELQSHGPNGKAWEKVWISQDVIMHLQGIEAQAGNLSDAINLFKRFESEARTDATHDEGSK